MHTTSLHNQIVAFRRCEVFPVVRNCGAVSRTRKHALELRASALMRGAITRAEQYLAADTVEIVSQIPVDLADDAD